MALYFYKEPMIYHRLLIIYIIYYHYHYLIYYHYHIIFDPQILFFICSNVALHLFFASIFTYRNLAESQETYKLISLMILLFYLSKTLNIKGSANVSKCVENKPLSTVDFSKHWPKVLNVLKSNF